MNELERKRNHLLKVNEEAHRWLDKEHQAQAFIDFHQRKVDYLTTALTSNVYITDHNGYLLALGQVQAHRSALSAIQGASDRATKAINELKEVEQQLGES